MSTIGKPPEKKASDGSLVGFESPKFELFSGSQEEVRQVQLAFMSTLGKVSDDDNSSSSFKTQEQAWKDFVKGLDTIEKVDLIAEKRPNLRRFLFGAHTQWQKSGRGVRNIGYRYGTFKHHPLLTEKTRLWILENHKYLRDKKGHEWILAIAESSDNIGELSALSVNYFGDSIDIRKMIARRDGLPPSIQNKLRSDPEREVRLELAQNTSISLESTEYFIGLADTELQVKVALSSRYCNTSFLERLYLEYFANYEIIRVVLGRIDISKSIIDSIYDFLLIHLENRDEPVGKRELSIVVDLAVHLGAHPRLSKQKRIILATKRNTVSLIIQYGESSGLKPPERNEYHPSRSSLNRYQDSHPRIDHTRAFDDDMPF